MKLKQIFLKTYGRTDKFVRVNCGASPVIRRALRLNVECHSYYVAPKFGAVVMFDHRDTEYAYEIHSSPLGLRQGYTYFGTIEVAPNIARRIIREMGGKVGQSSASKVRVIAKGVVLLNVAPGYDRDEECRVVEKAGKHYVQQAHSWFVGKWIRLKPTDKLYVCALEQLEVPKEIKEKLLAAAIAKTL